MESERRWKLIPQFLLRRAGFPFAPLASFSSPEASHAARELLGLRQAVAETRGALLRTLFPAEVQRLAVAQDRAALRLLSRWRKRVGHAREGAAPQGPWSEQLLLGHGRWRGAVEQERAAQLRLGRALTRENFQAREQLYAFFRQPQAREALFLLVPELLPAMESSLDRPVREQGVAADRAFERRLYAFAQRLCSKNETTSFFGPLSYGEVGGGGEGVQFGAEHPSGVRQKEAFFAFWAAAALGKAASAQAAVRAALPVRKVSVSTVIRQERFVEALGPEGHPVELSEQAAALYFATDDVRPVAALAEAVGVSVAEAEALVRQMERLGLLRRSLEPRSTTARPLEDLRKALPDIPAAALWQQRLSRFEAFLRKFEQAPLEERRPLLAEAEAFFTECTGLPARRAAGQTYADRSIVYEDCLGDAHPIRMPTGDAARLEEAVSPALRLGAAYGELRHRAVRTLASEVLASLPAPVPFLSFAAALDARIAEGALRAVDGPARALLQSLGARVTLASDGKVARLSAQSLLELLPEAGAARFASPDVMLCARPGQAPRFVLGEVHPYVFAWGSQGHFAPDRERFLAPFLEHLGAWGGAARLAMVLRRRRHKGLVSDAFPGTFIEVSGRSVDDPQRHVAIAQLHVRAGAAGPELWGPRGPLTLYCGEDDHPHLRVFAPPGVELPPVRLGTHTPRIEVGACVVQRERWDLPADSLQALVQARTAPALALEVAAAQVLHGWPRWLFAWSPSEVKPLCLDLTCGWAQSHLQKLASLGRISLSEMLPAPEDLWLQRSQGAYTSELRLALVRDP